MGNTSLPGWGLANSQHHWANPIKNPFFLNYVRRQCRQCASSISITTMIWRESQWVWLDVQEWDFEHALRRKERVRMYQERSISCSKSRPILCRFWICSECRMYDVRLGSRRGGQQMSHLFKDYLGYYYRTDHFWKVHTKAVAFDSFAQFVKG